MLKFNSFFSGVGGLDLGMEQAGMVIGCLCEKDGFARKVLEKHWPHVPLYEDINCINPTDLPFADVYVGGFPCQDVSAANQGKRVGLRGKRSGLFEPFYQLIRVNKPRWVVIENVPGILNSNRGKDFERVIGALDECGYGVAWRVLDAKYFGTPQRRRRVFIVASFGNAGAYEVLFADRPLLNASYAGVAERKGRNTDTIPMESRVFSIQHATISRSLLAGPQGKGYRDDGETWTLDSRGCADVVYAPHDPAGIRETTDVTGLLDRTRYRLIGNAVCVAVAKWVAQGIVLIEEGQVSG